MDEDLLHDVFRDDFRQPWDEAAREARWRVRPLPWLSGGDGRATTGPTGLTVESGPVAPLRGESAFTQPPAEHDGAAAHLRWAAFARPAAGRSPGDAALLRARSSLSAEMLGTHRHPAGDGPHCAMAAMIFVDLESGMAFDFALTNSTVWALYERLPRPGAAHGSFAYAIPVGERAPADRHECAVDVDRHSGSVRWLLDGTEVFAVHTVGRLLSSVYDLWLYRPAVGETTDVRVGPLTLGLGLLAGSAHGQGARLRARFAAVSAA
ncbi:DUF6081 family protein [Streptomyces sp. NPDC059639]|uniref:DUF6081 family protein n=1 Tax=Streptomyces sp. NPDC059639 TaxID=3346891 RepID=UPI00367D36CB